MYRTLAIFLLAYATAYGDGMIISFEETPSSEPICEVEENPQVLSRSPPKPDDLPIYPEDIPCDAELEPSTRGPNYFRKRKEPAEILPDQDSYQPIETEYSRESKTPFFRGRDKEALRSKYTEDYTEPESSFDRPESFFDGDSPSDGRFTPLPPSVSGYERTIMHTALIVFGFILLLLLFVWFLRKFGKGRTYTSTGREITVLDRKALSHKSILYLVKVNNKKFLIAESQLEVKAMRPVNIELEED